MIGIVTHQTSRVDTFFWLAPLRGDRNAIPLLLLLALSLVIGFLAVLAFGYFSDQTKIRLVKDRMQAHLLAVRLFQDNLAAVLQAYRKILWYTVQYLYLALKPSLIMLVPLLILVVYLDSYFGYEPVHPNESFLFTAQMASGQAMNDVNLQLPAGLSESALPVHIESRKEVVWRLTAAHEGNYQVQLLTDGQVFSKKITVSDQLVRILIGRWREHPYQHWLDPSEPSLPSTAAIVEMRVGYIPHTIDLGWVQCDWTVILFAASILTALIFKKLLGIEI